MKAAPLNVQWLASSLGRSFEAKTKDKKSHRLVTLAINVGLVSV